MSLRARPAPVFKATKMVRGKRTRVKVPDSVKALDRMSRRQETTVRINLVKGITTFRDQVSTDGLRDAIVAGGAAGAVEHIPWETLPEHLEPAFEGIAKTLDKAVTATVASVPAPKNKKMRFDASNPKLKKYLDTRAGALITNITAEQKDTIRSAIKNSFAIARTPLEIAKQIKGNLGLTEIQAGAVDRYRNGLIDGGTVSDARVESLSDSYSNSLLDQRAITIARTETAEATSQGQLFVWNEGVKEGLIPEDARKQWAVNPDACPKICAPMDGISVPLKERWTISTGKKDGSTRQVDRVTQAHPSCRCVTLLLFDETDDYSLAAQDTEQGGDDESDRAED